MEQDSESVEARDYGPEETSSAHSKRHKSKTKYINKALDIISGLPDALLTHILSFLNSKDSVKTGAVSKRWQYLWTSVPVLDFNSSNNLNHHDDHRHDEYLSSIAPRVESVLLLHESLKITKFFVRGKFDDEDHSVTVNRWLRFVTRKNVEELELIFRPLSVFATVFYVLPQFLYSNSSLTKLRLGYCEMLPHQPINWKSLKVLSLVDMQLSNHLIRDISSGCPSIKWLELYRCRGFDRVDINSKSLKKLIITHYLDNSVSDDGSALEILVPNIRSLELFGTYQKKIRVIDSSSLVYVKLNFRFYMTMDTEDMILECPDMMKELLQSIKHVRTVAVGNWCVQVLSVMGVKALDVPQLKCKSLTLDICLDKWDLPGISSLLKSSPDLETLVLNMIWIDNQQFPKFELDDEFLSSYDFEGENYWTSPKTRSFLKSVKTIKIIGFRGEQLEIELVKFLLKNARVLEKMIVANHGSWRKTSNWKELFTVATSLLSFPRSSSNAIILFS